MKYSHELKHGGALKHAEGKVPDTKGHTLYDSNQMTFWKWQNQGDTEKINGCQGFGGKEG